MARIITIHSFRRGTGKTSLLANLAVLMANEGLRVAVIDADFQLPSAHLWFGLEESEIKETINRFLDGQCAITDAAYRMTERLGIKSGGELYMVPASTHFTDILSLLRSAYDVERFSTGLQNLADKFGLNVVLLDTTAGLSQETLSVIAVTNTLVVVMRPDQQEYQGTAVVVDVARSLNVPNLCLVLNQTPETLAFDKVAQQLQETYKCDVMGILPFSQELQTISSRQILAAQTQHLRFVQDLRQVMLKLLAAPE